METMALLGTGFMGSPMALRLLSAGFKLTVWNRTPGKTKEAVQAGAVQAPTSTEAVAGASVVISMLTGAPAFEEVFFASRTAEAISPGAVVIDMSTTSPAVARDFASRLRPRKIDYIDAPVSGGTKGAAAGTLAIMAGGDEQLIARLAPVFKPMGNVRRIGPTGTGQLCKLANQAIVAVTIGAVAEALVIAEKGGADPAAVREALRGGFADSRILSEHGKRMIDRNFTPGGVVSNQIKDLNALQKLAGELGVTLPLTTTVQQLFDHLGATGGMDLDHAALFLEIERMAKS